MPTHAPSPDPPLAGPPTSLEELVLHFEVDPDGNQTLIQNESELDRDRFYASAVEILKTGADSPGAQCLIGLMLASGMLIPALCDPALTLDQAVAIGRAAMRADPVADAALARKLADSTLGMGDPVRDPARLMEVLSRIADASRILPSLMRLLRHQNPRLRSKVVKLIGRGSGSVKWIRAKLSEADPRVRANALEALWGVDTPEARALLLFSTKDANNRVLGNALIGLYYLGDSSVLEEIVKLSAHESALFRATAAWVMGETGDVRFSDIVRRLLLQQDPLVRKRALVALGRIKQANAEPGEPPWRISGSFETSPKIDGPRRVMAAVASIGAAELKRIAPIHFVLCEGGRYVTSYKVNEKPLADAINVIFIIPRTAEPGFQPFVEGILSCLQWKRPGDRWCLLPYAEDGDSGPAPESPLVHPLQYISEAKALETSLRQSAGSPDCGDLWGAIFRATRSETLSSRSRRHVIVLSRAQENRSAGNTLVTNAENGRAGVRVISSVQNPNLAAFCGRTHSQYRQALEEEIPEIVRDAYLSFLARYEITYQPVAAQAATLKLRVQSPDGWAETLVPIPPPE